MPAKPELRALAITTLHHVSVNVTDLDRAKRFYGGVLGLEEISRPPFDFPGAWYRVGDRQLHLIVHSPTHTLRGTTAISSREGHFAIAIASYGDACRHLEAAGVEFDAHPQSRTPWAQIFLSDPDGNLIELSATE